MPAVMAAYRQPAITFRSDAPQDGGTGARVVPLDRDLYAKGASPKGLPALKDLSKRVIGAQKDLDAPYSSYRQQLTRRVEALSTPYAMAVAMALKGEGPHAALRTQFPGKRVDIVMAMSTFAHEQIQYLVYDDPQQLIRHVVSPDGTLMADREASEAVVGRTTIKNGNATFKPLRYRKRLPVFHQPLWRPGTEVDIPSGHTVRAARLLQANADSTWTVEIQTAQGNKKRRVVDSFLLRWMNTPHVVDLDDGRIYEFRLAAGHDKALAAFLEHADAIAAPILAGSLGDPATVAQAQKRAVVALMKHVADHMETPSDEWGPGTIPEDDPRSVRYRELTMGSDVLMSAGHPLGEYIDIRAGICRHRATALQACLQIVGIDSRVTSGLANSSAGPRGPHAWLEVVLADGSRYVADPMLEEDVLPQAATYAGDPVRKRRELRNNTTMFDRYLSF